MLFRFGLAVLALALVASVILLRRAARPEAKEREGARAIPAVDLREGAALAAILILAAALRAIHLDSGLWYDEIVTLVEFVRLSATEIVSTYTALNNHLLYSLLAHFSVAQFGESAWALRLPAAALGVGSVAALWWLGRRVTDRWEALLAALLMAASYHHVWFSQNARGYTGLMMFGLISTALFLEGMRRERRWLWLLYAVTVALALYIHLSAVFLIAVQGLVYIALFAAAQARRIDSTRFPGAAETWPLLGFALGGIMAFALFAALIPQAIDSFSASVAATGKDEKVTAWTSPVWTALEIIRGFQLGFASIAGALAALLLLVVGGLSFLRRDPLFAWLVALPVPLILGILLALSFHIWPRYFFVLMGFAALALVRGAFAFAAFAAPKIGLGAGRAQPLGVALAAAVIVASLSSLSVNYALPKQNYAGARDYVRAQRGEGELVASTGLAVLPYQRYYAPEWDAVESLEELEALRATGLPTWLVYTFPAHLRSALPELALALERDFELQRSFPGTVGDGTLYVARSRARTAATKAARQ